MQVIERAEIIWMPNEAELENLREYSSNLSNPSTKDKPISSFLKYISKALAVKIHFKDVRSVTIALQKKNNDIDFDDIMESEAQTSMSSNMEFLYSVSCEIVLEQIPRLTEDATEAMKEKRTERLKTVKTKLINLLCTKPYSDTNTECWLTFHDISFLSEGFKLRNFIAYSEMDVRNFSLGNLVGLNTFVQHFNSKLTFENNSSCKINQVKVRFEHEDFQLYFDVRASSKKNKQTQCWYRLSLKYSAIQQILVSHVSNKDFVIYLRYLLCPLLFVSKLNVKGEKSAEKHENDKEKPIITYECLESTVHWIRAVDLYDGCPNEINHNFILNSVLRLELKQPEYMCLRHLLEQFCPKLTLYFCKMVEVSAESNPCMKITTSINQALTDFNCFYSMKCIMTRSYELIDQIIVRENLKKVADFLKAKCEENPKVLADAIIHIYNQMDLGSLVIIWTSLRALYESLLQEEKNKNKKERNSKEESKIEYIKRALLMPTHIRYLPPHPQLRNRILRICNSDLVMRVTVRDTNMERLDHTLKCSQFEKRQINEEFLDKYVKNPLMRGIKLKNRKYHFLGMSSSQIRTHSMWCYAQGPDKKTILQIRDEIGDFDEIKEVPKYMARMGLTFSQAISRITVLQEYTNVDNPEKDITGIQKEYMPNVEMKPDKFLEGKMIKLEEETDSSKDPLKSKKILPDFDPYIFSDGIGRMSQEIADEIYEDLELCEERPSAVQIRYAGCKGMLVLDPLLEGKKIVFRESMKKYNSNDNSLEILKYSKPRIVYFNRQLITILEQHGLRKDVFLYLQKKMINNLIRSMFYDENAKELLSANSVFQIDYDNLLHVGISFTEDPLFRSMILAIFKSTIGCYFFIVYLNVQKTPIMVNES